MVFVLSYVHLVIWNNFLVQFTPYSNSTFKIQKRIIRIIMNAG